MSEWRGVGPEAVRPCFVGPRVLQNNQGSGQQDWNIARKGKSKLRFYRDPFHTLAYSNLSTCILLVFSLYLLNWTIFAIMYWWTRCHWTEEQHKNFYDAFFFSVETAM